MSAYQFNYNGHLLPINQRDVGRRPLSNSATVNNLPVHAVPNRPVLKLSSITMYGLSVREGKVTRYVAVVIGHYEQGVHIEKRYADDVPAGNDLPQEILMPLQFHETVPVAVQVRRA
jgi:hypothetical protein